MKNSPYNELADHTQAASDLRRSLAGLRVKPVFRVLSGGSRSEPLSEEWSRGKMGEVNRTIDALSFDQADIRIIAPNGIAIPRQVRTDSRWLNFVIMRDVKDPQPFTEAQITGVTRVKYGRGPEGRRLIPIFDLLDVQRPDAQPYALSAPDVAGLIHREAADIVARNP